MYNPIVGRWMEEDPIKFRTGDADLYRYAGNDPTNATDASGLDFKFVGDKMVLVVQLEVEYVKEKEWTKKQRDAFESLFKTRVEAVWNNHPFYLVSKDGKKPYYPTIEVVFVQRFSNKDHKYRVKVAKDPLEGAAPAYVKGKTMYLSSSNALEPRKYEFIPMKDAKPVPINGLIAAHEFGHLIGINHPGAETPNPEDWLTIYSKNTPSIDTISDKGANSSAAYEADPFSVMGVGTEMRWWMFTPWTSYLNDVQAADAPWKVKADPKSKTYKTFYNNWEQYSKKRILAFRARLAFPRLIFFEER